MPVLVNLERMAYIVKHNLMCSLLIREQINVSGMFVDVRERT